jgi:hypothetical protein
MDGVVECGVIRGGGCASDNGQNMTTMMMTMPMRYVPHSTSRAFDICFIGSMYLTFGKWTFIIRSGLPGLQG